MSFTFSGSTFTRVYPTYDRQNRPAVGFDIDVPRHNDFGKFTGGHLDKQMAIVVDGEIVTAPNLNVELTRGGIIEGGAFGFKQEEVNELVRAINSGSLNVEPRFEDRETVRYQIQEMARVERLSDPEFMAEIAARPSTAAYWTALSQAQTNLEILSNEGVKIGVCGEHGGDPASIRFINGLDIDYVSCSPYRVPIARLSAAHAVLGGGR